MTWAAERMTGVWPANHWRLTRGNRALVVSGHEDAVMHAVEALNAYERPGLHPVSECGEQCAVVEA